MQKESNKAGTKQNPIPNWYLYVILSMLAIGFIINPLMTYVQDPSVLNVLVYAVVTLTCFWIFFNIYMFIYIIKKKIVRAAIAFPVYFLCINIANVLNFLTNYYTNYKVLFVISLLTKTVELLMVITILYKHAQAKKAKPPLTKISYNQ